MFYEKELQFLCDTFKKSRLRAIAVTADSFTESVFDTVQDESFIKISPENFSVSAFFGNLEERTLYRAEDPFGRSYVYLRLPETEKPTVLFIGPYLCAPLSGEDVLEICEKNAFPPASQKYLAEYYASLPIITENSVLFHMLDTFCERIWKTSSFVIVDINRENAVSASIGHGSVSSETFDGVLASIKAMEMRYDFENEMINAVALGQVHKEKRFSSAFSEDMFEKRTSDPLRNAKNYAVIMNTLLRKAAERGGVHPVHLNRVSSAFAQRIENTSSVRENGELMHEMFRSYCRLVQQHSIKGYSLTVQKSIMLIEEDLSANITPRMLAEAQNLNPSYLSTVFKKETGKTLSEYIREKRVKHALHLLTTTKLQIQTVALHCGIMDVQYFSKIFKRHTGMSPKEYREIANTQIKN